MGNVFKKRFKAAWLIFCLVVFTTGCSKLFGGESGVLIVGVVNENSEDSKVSDSVQVKNALSKGGQILVRIDRPFIDDTMPDAWKFGAADSDGKVYLHGAVLNYIASHGWTLAAVTTTFGATYYFAK